MSIDEATAPAPDVPVQAGEVRGARRGSRSLVHVRDYAIALTLLAVFVTLAVTSSSFLHWQNLLNVVDQSVPLGLIACAGTLVIIAGGFDLSTAAVYALAGVVAAKVAVATGNTPAAYAAGVAVGLGLGIVNGVIVTRVKISSFIVTLATGIMITGATVVVSQGNLVNVSSGSFAWLGFDGIGQVKYADIVLVIFALIMGFLLSRTVFGRYVFAAGGNEEAARLSGVRVDAVRTATYALSGVSAAIAGIVIASQDITGDPNAGGSIDLTAIAAIAIGGTSIFGGEGAIWRTIVGVFLIGLIDNGFNLLNLNPSYQDVVYGLIILAATGLDAFARRTRR